MQLRKLRYFSNLIHVQWKHYWQPSRCHHYRYQGFHIRQHNAWKWNLLMLLMVLITLIAAVIATTPSQPIAGISKAHSLQSVAYPQRAENRHNMNVLAAPTSENDYRNSTDDFEHILLKQLKREEDFKVLHASGSNENLKDQGAASYQQKTLLSRKRRYLLFPEGTSFQLVYDGIVGIVDYTNYLILGITVALAWELPTKAPSEMLEDIKMQIDDGTLLLPRNDTTANITYVDTKKKSQKSKTKTYSKPNYINFQNLKPILKQTPYYSSPRTSNKRPMIQPAWRPPMNGIYYYKNRNQSPYYNYYDAKPGTSMKYDYYYQPKVKTVDARVGLTPHNYGKEHFGDWRRKDNYYYKNVSHKPMHPFTKWLPTKSLSANSKYPWWNLNSRLTSSLRSGNTTMRLRPIMTATARQFNNVNDNDVDNGMRQQKRIQQQMSRSGYYQSSAPTTTRAPKLRKHHIYPVFGKRSLSDDIPNHKLHAHIQHEPELPTVIPQEEPHFYQQQREQQQQRSYQNEHKNHQNQHRQHRQHQPHQRHRYGIDNVEPSKFDRIHIRHHRRTRHMLYEKIEKYLDKRGSHGHHCVLRALCETGQKASDVEPGSFLGEIMRTLFTIPEPVEEDLHRLEYIENRYDAAHAYAGNCATRYFHCKDSLWKSHFIA